VAAWPVERAALLHVENRTAFPNIQEVFGAFNAKREYLGRELAARAGVKRWNSESHVMAALWSADVLRAIRQHRASFESLGPGGCGLFEAWWQGRPLPTGKRAGLIVFDPIAGSRRDRRRWAGLADPAGVRPRYRGCVEALEALRDTGLA
jgi:hypothetical protein